MDISAPLLLPIHPLAYIVMWVKFPIQVCEERARHARDEGFLCRFPRPYWHGGPIDPPRHALFGNIEGGHTAVLLRVQIGR